MDLNKLTSDTFGQMVASDVISDSFSKSLKDNIKKVGASVFLTAIFATSSGMAHAGDFRTIVGALGALSGVVSNGSKSVGGQDIDCETAGKNGWKIGGSSVLGAVVGSQIGGGSGKDLATVAGAVIGGAVANSSEEERIKQECYAKAAKNTEYQNNGGIPKYASNTNYVSSPIIYQGQTANGQTFWVTTDGSPGLAALKSNRGAVYSVDSDPIVKSALDRASQNLESSYTKLDEAAKTYKQVVNGKTTAGKMARYAVEDSEVNASSVTQMANQNKIYASKATLDEAFKEYAQRRAVLGNVLDNAAVDKYDITRYVDVISYFTPPSSLSVRYENGSIPNKYGIIPGLR